MTMKNVQDFYPLSPMQQGMLFHSLYAPESGVYVEQVSCTLRGELDVSAFKQAWQQVAERHAILRTAFIGERLKEPVQVVHRRVDLPWEEQDWRAFSEAKREDKLEAYLREERRKGFELSQPPLMRLALFRVDEGGYYFAWTYHHILLDGWSLPVLLQEIFTFYEALQRNRALHLDPPRPFRDYIAWLRRQDMEEAEVFWRQTLGGFTAPTPLTVDERSAGIVDSMEEYGEREIQLSARMLNQLRAMAQQNQLTLNTLVQGAWALLLSRYSGEEDIVFGATVSGRPPEFVGSDAMVGLFINTLPVRVRVKSDDLLLPWLKVLQAQLVAMRQFEYCSLVQIQGWSDVPRGLPLFNSILVFENYPVGTSLEGQKISLQVEDIRSVERTDLPLTVVAGAEEELVLKIAYDGQRFDAATIERMLGHLGTCVEGMLDNLERPLLSLPLLTRSERKQLLTDWNATEVEYGLDRCVHELFEAQVKRTPDSTAVAFGDQSLTYSALNHRANKLAAYLQKLGVGPEKMVGICVERSVEMVVGLLGILKAGGAYLPLDPAYPEERLAYMLADSGSLILLTQEHLKEKISESTNKQITQYAARTIVCLDTEWPTIAQEPETSLATDVTPDNLAYVIYTSGSTGRPKGTMLAHQGLVNLGYALAPAFEVDADSRVLQFASLSFDASVAEIFMALLTGATLVLASRENLVGSELIDLMREKSITTVTLPPSMLAVLSAELPELKTVASAGEACSLDIVARWGAGRRFLNGYGPTETTVAASYYLVNDDLRMNDRVPIGHPLPNTKIHILDAHLQPVPIGVPGELHVGGISLARGYLNRPELTATKFIPDPFSNQAGERLYKTGDLARYRADGNVEFLGRIDHQVKVRGFRIELGEIETVLEGRSDLRQVVALVREDVPGDKRLVAYAIPEPDQAPPVQELKLYTQEKLPGYMVPSAFVLMPSFPLLPNGKVDRRALPPPSGVRMSKSELVPPRNALELQLTQLWEEILNVKPIGVKDNFYDLGGHSLLAVRLAAQMEQHFDRKISLVTLLQNPTIERVAAVLRQREDASSSTASLVPLQPDGSKNPLFFVHPSGGSVHWYADLARHLAPDQPLYGFQAQGLHRGQELHVRVEEMATHYVGELRGFQPEGPYLLGSWSMGVVVAFEMAQQLLVQGQEVAFLAMLDQGPFLPAEEPKDDAAYLVDVFGKHLPLSLDHLRRMERDEQVAHVFEEAKKVNWISPDITLPQFQYFVRLLRTHTEAWRSYEPQTYPGQVTLFRANEQSHDGNQGPDMGWGALAAGGVQIHEIPGDHLSMMHEPHVQILAQRLQVCLDAMAKNEEIIQG